MRALLLISVLLAGCSAGMNLPGSRGFADQFMEKLAKGDINGAWEMCDHNQLSRDTLDRIANNPEFTELFRGYKGLEHGQGGNFSSHDGFDEVLLSPAKLKGQPEWQVRFGLRKYPDGYKVMAFQIERVTPE
ncbi:MAG: hypothetical protein KF696_07965 [Planctomycetes bacterium]|nr:hypothetical protein [Planctomycetota bacterium]MCW8135714.1 hypothetical protein [Planctomycetota bacterium]